MLKRGWQVLVVVAAVSFACNDSEFVERLERADNMRAQRDTVKTVRDIGAAWFSWLTDQMAAASPGQKTYDVAGLPLLREEDLRELLVPTYLETLETHDGWGNALEFRLHERPGWGSMVMSVRSAGSDGIFSDESYAIGPFPFAESERDIVWADGFFIQYPQ